MTSTRWVRTAKRAMTTSADKPGRACLRCAVAYTLLEVLMALAIAGLMAAISIPLLLDTSTGIEAVEEEVRSLARKARASALETGEARWLVIAEQDIEFLGSGEAAALPEGWVVEVRRIGEVKFRKPRENEMLEFNAEGICEPLSLRLRGPTGELLMAFDPLTALEPPGV